MKRILHERGILGPHDQLEFFLSSSQVTVTGGADTIELFDQLATMAHEERPVQIRYVARRQDGDSWETLPTLVALPGQPATLEQITEIPNSPDGENFEIAHFGTSLQIQGELYGFGERTSLQYSHIARPDSEHFAAFAQSGRIEDLSLQESRLEVPPLVTRVIDRQSQTLYELRGEDNGKPVTIRLFGERIDSTGQRIPGPFPRDERTVLRPINLRHR